MNQPCAPITPKRVVEKDFMRVYCCLKPILPVASSCIEVISDTMVKLLTKDPSKPKFYKFKRVFTETKTQQEIFNEVAIPLIEQLVNGKNGLLLTYDVTNNGKTYAVTGTRQDIDIMPRCLDVLFNSINDFQTKKFTFKLNRANKFIVQSKKKYLNAIEIRFQTTIKSKHIFLHINKFVLNYVKVFFAKYLVLL